MSKIIVTGGSGMVGKSLKDLVKNSEHSWVFLSSKDCDLTNHDEVDKLFEREKPTYVVHLAANVGGLFKNMREKTSMFKDNVRMNENILEICNKHNVQKGIFCLSSCIFPYKPSKFPMDESMMHESAPHPSNEGYGYSKRMMEMQCRNYNQQFNREYICLIPVNLYGPYDNFNLNDSHVIAGLIHRFHIAQKDNLDFSMYGSGTPLRQFITSDDFSKIILLTLFNYEKTDSLICCNDEITIKELTYLVGKLSGYDVSKIKQDKTKADGCLRKTVDGSYFKTVFPDFRYTSLEDGVKNTIKWFHENYDNCRK